MALIECKECGQMISDKAVACPKCGCPVEHTEVETNEQLQVETPEKEATETYKTTDNTSNYQKDEKATGGTTGSTTTGGTTTGGTTSSASYTYVKPSKDKTVAAILAFFLGGLGIHHFYLGNNDRGLSYLIVYVATWFIYSIFGFITFGIGYALWLPVIMVVMSIIDMVHYLQDTDESFEERIAREVDPLWKKVIY